MKLSAPIFLLKHKAKKLARENHIPLHEALNKIAKAEGFISWSLLSARAVNNRPSAEFFEQLSQGDLILLGARPGHGKTKLALSLCSDAIAAGKRAVVFSLEFHVDQVSSCFQSIGGDATSDRFQIDCADNITADYIVDRLGSVEAGTLVVIDYLQILDQKREVAALSEQISVLQSFAKQAGIIVVCVSQIDRSFEVSGRALPEMQDVRLPNPVDLSLFNKACFLNNGEMRVERYSI